MWECRQKSSFRGDCGEAARDLPVTGNGLDRKIC